MNDHQRALACADEFRRRGLTPLPSRMDLKGPMLGSYAEHFKGEPVPESVYRDWATTNLQLITGANHPGLRSIVVVDLDGDEAASVWKKMCEHNNYRPQSAWISRTGSGGTHLYYSLPDEVRPCAGGVLWGLWDTWGSGGKGAWAKHKEVRLLADNALVVAPPSLHVETGRRYAFLPTLGPNQIAVPEAVPAWVLALPRLAAPRLAAPRPEVARKAPGGPSRFVDRNTVLEAIHDKLALARSWGLDTARDAPNANGWVSCYYPGREDRNAGSRPSGSIHERDGVIQDRKDNSTMSFFDLGAALQPGKFHDWKECQAWCASRYL